MCRTLLSVDAPSYRDALLRRATTGRTRVRYDPAAVHRWYYPGSRY